MAEITVAESAMLRILGPPILEDGRGPVLLSRRKSMALLAYLALEAHDQSRDSLAAIFWPECGQSRARANLRSCIFDVNHALSRAVLLAEGDRVGMIRAGIRIDVEDFKTLAAPCSCHGPESACPSCASRLEAAPRLWRAGFMAGFTLADSNEFDEWQIRWGGILRGEYCSVLRRLATFFQDSGQLTEAERCISKWIGADPFDEEARMLQIRVLVASGRKARAVECYETWGKISRDELGKSLSREVRELVADLLPKNEGTTRAGAAFDGKKPIAAEFSAAQEVARRRADLIGRDVELESIGERLLAGNARLHTITGTGGIGKTALARGLIAERCDRFGGGAFFVDLSSIRDAALVPFLVAADLGIGESSSFDQEITDRVASRIGSLPTLLVLDNFEQILEAKDFVSRILDACPRLVIVATSREHLNLEGEMVHELGALAFPPDLDCVAASDAHLWPALSLLARRALNANPFLELSDRTMSLLAALCARLDGIPLAIELAASRLAMLEPEELLDRISKHMALASSSRGLPARHRTLRAVLDWSYELLDMPERRLFAMLAVFPDSFDLAAVEGIFPAEVESEGERDPGILDTLASLVGKSLLRRIVENKKARFSFFETIREFARERLDGLSDVAWIRRGFAFHYLSLAEREGPGMHGSGQLALMRSLDLDQDNFFAALENFTAVGASGESLRLCAALEWYWYRAGHFEWGRRSLESALSLRPAGADPSLRGNCLRALGWLRFTQGAWHEAHGLYLEAASTLEACGDRALLAKCLSDLGVVERWLGNRVTGDLRCREAIAIAREGGKAEALTYALIWAYGTTGGIPADEEHRTALEEAIGLARRAGDSWAEAHSLESLGDVLREQGKTREAEPCYLEAFRGFDSLGDDWLKAWTLEGLGINACKGGDAARGVERLRGSLRLFARLGDRGGVIHIVGELALAEEMAGSRDSADLLFGAFSVMREEFGLGVTAGGSARSLPDLREEAKPDAPRTTLDAALEGAAARATDAWHRGRRMSYEGIMAFALENERGAVGLAP